MTPVPRLRANAGPALFSYGFRPFFLFGAWYSGLAIAIWLPLFYGDFALPTAFSPLDWHVHEMLYGYLPAAITGFLLTAIPNWTGRLPLQGGALVFLLAVWSAGRLAVSISAEIGWIAGTIIDSSFLLLVLTACAREVAAGRNWGNVKVLLPLSLLALGNIAFHLEAHFWGAAEYAIRLGIAAVLLLIMLIGGRIIPSFTRNMLARSASGRLPAPFGRLDVAAIVVSGAALLAWIAAPNAPATAAALGLAAVAQTARLVRWAGERTWRDPLVFVLHAGYSFLPLGFALAALAPLGVLPQSGAIHAWMAGGAGLMTLAVMTRASLGHTGRTLKASRLTQLIYACALLAALARIYAVVHPATSGTFLAVAALAWSAAFVGFGIVYAPVLMQAKVQNRAA